MIFGLLNFNSHSGRKPFMEHSVYIVFLAPWYACLRDVNVKFSIQPLFKIRFPQQRTQDGWIASPCTAGAPSSGVRGARCARCRFWVNHKWKALVLRHYIRIHNKHYRAVSISVEMFSQICQTHTPFIVSHIRLTRSQTYQQGYMLR